MFFGPLVLGTTIVHPAGADIVAEATQLNGIAAHLREAQKMDAYKKDVDNGVYDFCARDVRRDGDVHAAPLRLQA